MLVLMNSSKEVKSALSVALFFLAVFINVFVFLPDCMIKKLELQKKLSRKESSI